jgi:hypothetical protein
MKTILPLFLLTALLFFYTLPGYNNLYGKGIDYGKVNGQIHAGWNNTTAAYVKYKSNTIANTAGTLHASLYLLNPDSSIKFADGVAVQYDSAYSDSINYMDALKFTNINENLALLLDGYSLSIERRSTIYIRDTLFFNLTKTTIRSYQFQFTTISLTQPGLFGFLKDSYTGDSTLVDLDGFTSYNFSVNNDAASKNPKRFMLVFETIPGGGIVPLTYRNIKAWQQNGNIDLEWSVENEMNIKSYTIERSSDGHTFNSITSLKSDGNNSSNVYNWVDANTITGQSFYRVRCTGTNGFIQYSQVVKVDIGARDANISVYPNPIKNGIVGLQLTNMPKGTYQLQILNDFGQSIVTKLINHNGGNAFQTVLFNSSIPKGLYELEIIQPDKSKVVNKVQFQ